MKAQIVSFHCVLKDTFGKVLSSSFNQDVINQLEGAPSSVDDRRLRGLVAGIQNVRKGERREFAVSAGEAFGLYDPNLVLNVRRSDLLRGEDLVIGSQVTTHSRSFGSTHVFRVVKIDGDKLVLDGNHPLAGQDLIFNIEVVSARDARQEDFEEPMFTASEHVLH